jgi:gas vesicle protein
MARKGNFILGVAVGAAAGAITALLYAPRRGDEMRREIKDKAAQAGSKAKDVWSDTKDQTCQVACTVADRSKHMMERCREMVDSGTSRFRDAVMSGRQAASEKREELEAELGREEEMAETIAS